MVLVHPNHALCLQLSNHLLQLLHRVHVHQGCAGDVCIFHKNSERELCRHRLCGSRSRQTAASAKSASTHTVPVWHSLAFPPARLSSEPVAQWTKDTPSPDTLYTFIPPALSCTLATSPPPPHCTGPCGDLHPHQVKQLCAVLDFH